MEYGRVTKHPNDQGFKVKLSAPGRSDALLRTVGVPWGVKGTIAVQVGRETTERKEGKERKGENKKQTTLKECKKERRRKQEVGHGIFF